MVRAHLAQENAVRLLTILNRKRRLAQASEGSTRVPQRQCDSGVVGAKGRSAYGCGSLVSVKSLSVPSCAGVYASDACQCVGHFDMLQAEGSHADTEHIFKQRKSISVLWSLKCDSSNSFAKPKLHEQLS